MSAPVQEWLDLRQWHEHGLWYHQKTFQNILRRDQAHLVDVDPMSHDWSLPKRGTKPLSKRGAQW